MLFELDELTNVGSELIPVGNAEADFKAATNALAALPALTESAKSDVVPQMPV